MNPSERRNDNFEDEHDDEDEYDLRGKRKGDRSKSREAKRGQVKISGVVNSDPDRQRKLWTAGLVMIGKTDALP